MWSSAFVFAEDCFASRPFFSVDTVDSDQKINQAANKRISQPENPKPTDGSSVLSAFEQNMDGS